MRGYNKRTTLLICDNHKVSRRGDCKGARSTYLVISRFESNQRQLTISLIDRKYLPSIKNQVLHNRNHICEQFYLVLTKSSKKDKQFVWLIEISIF